MSIGRLLSEAEGNKDEPLANYHQAMVFLQDADTKVGYTMCNIAEMKQLLNCEGINIYIGDSFNVQQIRGMFESVDKFKWLAKMFDDAHEIDEMEEVSNAMFSQLRKYFSDEVLTYKDEDVAEWEKTLNKEIIEEVKMQLSENVVNFIEAYPKSIYKLAGTDLTVNEILECRCYADLITKIAIVEGII